jgi:hypothetical protein
MTWGPSFRFWGPFQFPSIPFDMLPIKLAAVVSDFLWRLA